MFVDEAIVELYAGDGGDGCMAFRREKYVAMGGPFGGNGGKGSDIVFKVDTGLNTLVDFKYKKRKTWRKRTRKRKTWKKCRRYRNKSTRRNCCL